MRDYNNYDYITVYGSADREEELGEFYSDFGWTVYEKKLGRGGIVITFQRPHNISQKDRLQFLQVNAEAANNRFARLAKRKHSFSVLFALVMLPFGAILLLTGITYAVNQTILRAIVGGILVGMVGLVVLIGAIPALRKLVAQENAGYGAMRQRAADEIRAACTEAREIING